MNQTSRNMQEKIIYNNNTQTDSKCISLDQPLCFKGLNCQCLAHSTVTDNIKNCQLTYFRIDNAAFTDFLRLHGTMWHSAVDDMSTLLTAITHHNDDMRMQPTFTLRRTRRCINVEHSKGSAPPQPFLQVSKVGGKATHHPMYLLHLYEVRTNFRETFTFRKRIFPHVVNKFAAIYGTRNLSSHLARVSS